MLTVGIAASGAAPRLAAVLGRRPAASAPRRRSVSIAVLGPGAPRRRCLPLVACLGFFNGVFAVAAIGVDDAARRRRAAAGAKARAWASGARAQALAAGFGGLLGAAAPTPCAAVADDAAEAFAAVFLIEAALFLAPPFMALRVMDGRGPAARPVVRGNEHDT